jgi:hypothetical protein
MDDLPDDVPPIPPGSGGVIALVQPGEPGETLVAETGPESPLYVRVERSREVDRSLVLRLVAVPLPPDVGSLLPAGVLGPTAIQLDFYTPYGTILHEHAQPVEVCTQPPADLLQSADGNLSRLAVMRFNTETQRFERWPVTTPGDPASAGRLCIQTTETSLFVLGVLPDPIASRGPDDQRFFTQTGFRIDDDAFWNYFQRMGGQRVFGYPLSRPIRLNGLKVQIFQNRALERLPSGEVISLSLLGPVFLPYRGNLVGSALAPDSYVLHVESPLRDEPNIGLRAWSFVKSHTSDVSDQGAATEFQTTYFGTVTCQDVYYDRACPDVTMRFLNFDLWGYPLSDPAPDPTQPNIMYQVFERGILRVDTSAHTMLTLAIGQIWQSLITGRDLTPELNVEAADSIYWRQYNNLNVEDGLHWPDDLPNSSLVSGFAAELPREDIAAVSYQDPPQSALPPSSPPLAMADTFVSPAAPSDLIAQPPVPATAPTDQPIADLPTPLPIVAASGIADASATDTATSDDASASGPATTDATAAAATAGGSASPPETTSADPPSAVQSILNNISSLLGGGP